MSLEKLEQLDYLEYLLSMLTPRQRALVSDKYVMGFTAKEIGIGVDGVSYYIPRSLMNGVNMDRYISSRHTHIIRLLKQADRAYRRAHGVRSTQHGVS